MYRVNGKLVRETIGTAAIIPNVGDARARARESLQKAQSGINPVEARRTSSAKAAQEASVRAAQTFAAGADRYLKECVEKNTRPATLKETRRIIERDVKPRWATTAIRDIARQDVNELLGEIADRGALVQANRTLARLKTLFSWALDKDLIDNDPTARVRRRIKESAPRSSPQRRRNPPFLGRLRKAGLAFRPDVQAAAADRATAGRGGGIEWTEIEPREKRVWVIPREKGEERPGARSQSVRARHQDH
jgi:Phage integrase central domain